MKRIDMKRIDDDDIKCAIITKDTYFDADGIDTITNVIIEENLKAAYKRMVDHVKFENEKRGNTAYIVEDETINDIPIKCVIFDGKSRRVSNWELAPMLF